MCNSKDGAFHAPTRRVRFLKATPCYGVAASFDETELLRTLGANIRRERLARGFTQERLAELAELNPSTVQKLEAGSTAILVTLCSIEANHKRVLRVFPELRGVYPSAV